jgi:hypothetical protein
LDEIVEKMIRQNPSERFQSIKEVKQFLKVRGRDFVTEQKLSILKSAVIPSSEIDDPLITTPIRIEDFEWENNTLTLILSQPVNQKWRQALINMGSHTSLMGKEPEKFRFEGNHATVSSEERSVQRIIDYFKTWIPLATKKYEQDLLNELVKKRKRNG